jgi:hypothetical protein
MDVKALNEEVVELDEVLYQLEQDMEVRKCHNTRFPNLFGNVFDADDIGNGSGVLGARH